MNKYDKKIISIVKVNNLLSNNTKSFYKMRKLVRKSDVFNVKIKKEMGEKFICKKRREHRLYILEMNNIF